MVEEKMENYFEKHKADEQIFQKMKGIENRESMTDENGEDDLNNKIKEYNIKLLEENDEDDIENQFINILQSYIEENYVKQ